jgi:hypothetical protein
VFGTVTGNPPGTSRIFMVKELAESVILAFHG